jgi:hypothetical protein
MFSAYKSRVANKDDKPTPESIAIEACATPPPSHGSAEETVDTSKCESKDIVASVYAPTPESTLQYVPDLRELGTQLKGGPKCAEAISFSDSAYSSCPSGSQPVTASFHNQEPATAKLSGIPGGQFSFGGGGMDDHLFDELSGGYYSMPLTDADFSLFDELDGTSG